MVQVYSYLTLKKLFLCSVTSKERPYRILWCLGQALGKPQLGPPAPAAGIFRGQRRDLMLLLRSSGFFASALYFCLQQGSPLGSHADSQPFVSSTGCDDGQLPVLCRRPTQMRATRGSCCLSWILRRMKKKVQMLRTAYRAAIKGLETN